MIGFRSLPRIQNFCTDDSTVLEIKLTAAVARIVLVAPKTETCVGIQRCFGVVATESPVRLGSAAAFQTSRPESLMYLEGHGYFHVPWQEVPLISALGGTDLDR